MYTRELTGMEYKAFEIKLPLDHTPKEFTKALRRVLEDEDGWWLTSVATAADFDGKDFWTLYTVVLERG